MNRPASPLDVGPSSSASRYEMLATIASGGMATVYVGRMRGAGGFSRMVAVKRAHPHLLTDPSYRAMLVDEARLAAKLHHPNVVAVLDVEELEGELSLVMDYVEGASFYDLLDESNKAGRPLPPRIAMRVALDACAGLHAAHTLSDEFGRPLGLVHRDVSPQNILVGLDGVSRLSDFGIAKHSEGVATTTGVLKGKLSYMAPEYLESTRLDARSDVFSLGVVVWEALAGQKLFRGKSELETFKKVVATVVPPLSSVAPWANERLDAILFAALARAPEHRFASAEDFGIALEAEARYGDVLATPTEVGACVRELFGEALAERRADVRRHSAPITIERPPVSSTSLARHQAPTLVARAPTPVPARAPTPVPASAPARASAPVPARASAPEEVTAETSGLQRKAQPPPAPTPSPPPPAPPAADPGPPVRTSSRALWVGTVVLCVLATIGGVIAFRMRAQPVTTTRSGGDARPSSTPSSTSGASTSAVVSPLPPPSQSTAQPVTMGETPKPPAQPVTPATSIAVNALPDATSAPSASSHRLGGRMPTKGRAPADYPVTTGVPLSAWPPAPPPPAPEAPPP